ncbi:hypothetical protein C5E44_26520 [Nocardia nova]|nr:hypothetical protein C5E44_26520 [Nocardia nova]
MLDRLARLRRPRSGRRRVLGRAGPRLALRVRTRPAHLLRRARRGMDRDGQPQSQRVDPRPARRRPPMGRPP